MSEQTKPQGRRATPFWRFAQALGCALFLGWITDASSAEVMLMFMVMQLQLDNYYE